MLNITRDTGEFLAVLVKAMLARRVIEIGTSCLFLAQTVRGVMSATAPPWEDHQKSGGPVSDE